jgi:uncharacterized membrane protein
MDLRLALYELAARHRLDAAARHRLEHLAGFHTEPAALPQRLPLGVALLAATLGGLGIIFWIAANWESLGRFGRFALLQAVLLVFCTAALWRPRTRAPLALVALLATGGLFAYFGQTYQTGADPWQLFALWAALTLPLALAVRSDVVWTPWVLVAMTGVSLWVHAHTGHRWRVEPHDLRAHAIGWLSALVLIAATSQPARRFTGAGPWALRTAITLWVLMVTAAGIFGLFHSTIAPHYWLGLALFALAAAALATPRLADVYGLSAVGLGLDTLLVAGVAWGLLHDHRSGEPIGSLLLIGLIAAGLLAATVSLILRVARSASAAGDKA